MDLAGSEKASENTGGRFREGCYINKSLLMLSNVISKLSEGVRYKSSLATCSHYPVPWYSFLFHTARFQCSRHNSV